MNKVLAEPKRIPSSKEIKSVPEPIPRRWEGDKSAIQAKSVGLFTPVAIPNTIDAAVYA